MHSNNNTSNSLSWAHYPSIHKRLDRVRALLTMMSEPPPQQAFTEKVTVYIDSIPDSDEWVVQRVTLDEKQERLPPYFIALQGCIDDIVEASYVAMQSLAALPVTKKTRDIANMITMSLPGWWWPECTVLDSFKKISVSNAYNHPIILSNTFAAFSRSVDPEKLADMFPPPPDDYPLMSKNIKEMLLLKTKMRTGDQDLPTGPQDGAIEDTLNHLCNSHIHFAHVAADAANTMVEAVMLDDGLNNPDNLSHYADAELPWLVRLGDTALRAAEEIRVSYVAYMDQQNRPPNPRLEQPKP